MNEPWVTVDPVTGACAVLVALVLAACVLVLRQSRRELAKTRREAAELRLRVDGLAEQIAHQEVPPRLRVEATEFLITGVGVGAAPDPESEVTAAPERIEGRLFADIVLREAVLRAASLTHGVRRALAPETRNRIRFEMRREVKRSRKQRRADLKLARRAWEARQRDSLQDEDAA